MQHELLACAEIQMDWEKRVFHQRLPAVCLYHFFVYWSQSWVGVRACHKNAKLKDGLSHSADRASLSAMLQFTFTPSFIFSWAKKEWHRFLTVFLFFILTCVFLNLSKNNVEVTELVIIESIDVPHSVPLLCFIPIFFFFFF